MTVINLLPSDHFRILMSIKEVNLLAGMTGPDYQGKIWLLLHREGRTMSGTQGSCGIPLNTPMPVMKVDEKCQQPK